MTTLLTFLTYLAWMWGGISAVACVAFLLVAALTRSAIPFLMAINAFLSGVLPWAWLAARYLG